MATVLVVDELGVFLVGAPVVGARRVLQLGNRVGRPHVVFAACTPCVFTACVQHGGQHRVVAKGGVVHAQGFFGNFENTHAFNLAGRAIEELVDGDAVQANGLKQLRTAVAHVGRHAHLGHDFGQPFANRFGVVVDGFVWAELTRQTGGQLGQRFKREIRMDSFSAVTRQHGEVMHFSGRTGFNHQTGGGAQPFTHQMLVHCRQSQYGRNSNLRRADSPVTDDQDVFATLDGIHRFCAKRSQFGFDPCRAPSHRVSDVQRVAFELALRVGIDVTQFLHVSDIQQRLTDFESHRRVHLVDVQQVRLGADKGHQRHDDGFADRVDRRVGHLGKQLLEVVVQRLVFVRQHSQRTVVAHRAGGFFAIDGHGRHQKFNVFLRVAECLLFVQQGNA